MVDGNQPGSVVVTGATGGIGSVIVERLSVDGPVVAFDRVPVGAPSAQIIPIIGDGRDPKDVARAVEAAEQMAPLRSWVNCAAVFEDRSLADHTADEVVDAVMANVEMAVVGCQAAVQAYRAVDGPGSIVNLSSHQGQRPVRGALPYATAKAAIEGLTRAIAVDHGPDGIRCNAVALGTIVTDRYAELVLRHPSVADEIARLHPLGRPGTAAEVAEVVAFLLSDGAAFVSGAVVPIDGGRSALGLDPEADGS